MINLTIVKSNIQDAQDIIKFQLANGDHDYIIFATLNLEDDKNEASYFLGKSECANLRELLKKCFEVKE